jgi:hypothetical protein
MAKRKDTPTVLTREQIALLRRYEEAQTAQRMQLASTVYNNVLRMQMAWADFQAKLAEGGEFATLAEQYAADSAPGAEGIAAIEAAMATIVDVMRQMEAADPGMFGIVLPEPEPPVEPEPEPEPE